ncbi:hypothetical protein [Flavobacterium davisii]|uniref:hypothetical protein n=1 Tax=Flavobacterium davisii TaxID=2906077 RepID=UPI002869E742|nr:hypothetical protein [Flavobacterium davisii]
MRFVIITHVQHINKDNQIFGYAPYIREMNLWLKNVDELILVAPKSKGIIDPIWLPYEHQKRIGYKYLVLVLQTVVLFFLL